MPRLATNPLLAVVALAGVTTVDLAYNNGPSSSTAQPPAMYDVLEPGTRNATIAILKSKVVADATRRDRIELAGLGFHWPNASLTHSLENTLGYNPLRLALYSEATGAEDHVGLPDQRKFSPLFPSYRSKLANLLGLRFIATGAPIETMDPRLKAGDLPLVARTTDGYIYENRQAFPRVLFATEARATDFDRMLADGVWPDVDLRTTVLLERAPPLQRSSATGAVAPRRPGSVRIVSYRNTEVVLEADSPDGGFVVLNDLWHPWWFAEIDGKPAPILRANVLFRAVRRPAGPAHGAVHVPASCGGVGANEEGVEPPCPLLRFPGSRLFVDRSGIPAPQKQNGPARGRLNATVCDDEATCLWPWSAWPSWQASWLGSSSSWLVLVGRDQDGRPQRIFKAESCTVR